MHGERSSDERLDGLLEQMRPRMAAARRSHFQRIAGIAILIPGLLLGGGLAVATAQGGDDGAPVEVAGPATDDEPAEEPAAPMEPAPESATTDQATDSEDADQAVMVAELGLAGEAEYTRHDDVLVLGKVLTNDGWTATVLAAEGPTLVVYLEHESGSKLVASIGIGGNDEPKVRLEVPQSGVPKPKPEPIADPVQPKPEEPKPQAPTVETRKEIDVNGYGGVVVERIEGNMLTAAISWTAAGWQSKVLAERGEVVKVKFFNEQYIKTVKAWVGEDGKIHHEILVEELAKGPELQMRKEIDVNGYGRVVVERDSKGLLWMAILSTAAGWQSQVPVQHGEVVQARFSNEQYIKTVKAWVGEDGKIHHEILVEELAPPQGTGTFDGVVNTEFGSYGVVVKNGTATIVWVESAAGFEYSIHQETGEWVKVNFVSADQSWWVKAWGQDGVVVKEVYPA